MRSALAMLAAMAALLAGANTSQAATVDNGDFETGDLTGWTVTSTTSSANGYWFAYTGTVAPLTGAALNSTIAAPPQGNYAAVTDQVNPGRRILDQEVDLPQISPGATMTLSLYAYYKAQQGALGTPSPETLDPNAPGVNEQYRIDVMKPSAALDSVAPADVLLKVFQTQTGDPQTLPPTRLTADLTPFAGQTVRLRFAEVDNSGVLNASTDEVRIRVQPTLSTATSQIGDQIVDSATLGGAAPTGQIEFSLYGPDDPTCTGSPIFTSTSQVSGNGVYDSAAFTPSQSGSYRWIASYSGDLDHDPISGACGDPGETIEVSVSPPPVDPPTPPPVGPTISQLRVDPKSFVTGSAETALVARAQTGARIRFTLSKDADVRFRIRHAPRSRPGEPKHSHAFVRSLRAGEQAVRFTGTLDGRTFGPGRYVVNAVAIDDSNRRSTRESARFRIVN